MTTPGAPCPNVTDIVANSVIVTPSTFCMISDQDNPVAAERAIDACCLGKEKFFGACGAWCEVANQADVEEWTECMTFEMGGSLTYPNWGCTNVFTPEEAEQPLSLIQTSWRTETAARATASSSSSIAVSLTTSVPAGSSSVSGSASSGAPAASTTAPPPSSAVKPASSSTSPVASTSPSPTSSGASGYHSISYGATAIFGLVLLGMVL